MPHPSIITLGGKPGSGKSSTGNELARVLGWQRFSSGDFMRDIARARGMTITQLGKAAESDPSIDESIDQAVREAGQMEHVVIDSRLAFHWIPEALKVYLDLNPHAAARRILADMTEARKNSEEILDSVEELAENIEQRRASENKRYYELYGINPGELSQYDLVIDTGQNSLEAVVEMILKEHERSVKSEPSESF